MEQDQTYLNPKTAIKGRGADLNPKNRFDLLYTECDPEWDPTQNRPPKTEIFKDSTKHIITTNDSPDVGFSASLNPYRGCEHGCIYCYARPGHEYFGLSCGVDFESKIFAKENAAELLRKELSKKSWEPQVIAMSGVTDPYQPVERKLRITRGCLEVLRDFRNPVGLITKNHLIVRDIDILEELHSFECVSVNISITTLKPELARVMEPRASTPSDRLKAVEELSKRGIPVNVMVAPVIPALTDEEIPAILKAAASAGATSAGYIMVKLPYANKELFENWLANHFPLKKDKVLDRIRSVRGGKLYDAQFGQRMSGTGIFADGIADIFELSCRKNGLNKRRWSLSTEFFQDPNGSKQYTLF